MDRLFSYLNSLDDEYYFFIANTLLGKVTTPFHKPVINGAILSFLLNKENRVNIVRSLGDDDKRILALLSLVGSASAQQVQSFFRTESFPIILTELESLRDRLILLRENDSYLLNPILEEVISPSCDPNQALGEDKGPSESLPHVGRNVLFAVLNLLTNGSVPPREANAHHFVKSDRLEKVFPQFDKKSSVSFYTSLKALLQSEGAIMAADGRFAIDYERASYVTRLDDLNLMIASIGSKSGDSITRLLGILRNHSLTEAQAICLLGMFSNEKSPPEVLSSMAAFGFISMESGILRLNPAILEKPLERSKVNVDSDLEVTYYGVPEFDDILYLFADIEVCDNLVRYKITKDSFIRALDLGIEMESIISYLGTQRFDGQFSIWRDSFSRIRFYDGPVVNCTDQVGQMMRQHPAIRAHIIADLGNAFVMDRSPDWQSALAYALDLNQLPLSKGEKRSEIGESQTKDLAFSITEPRPNQKTIDYGSGESLRLELIKDAEKKGCLTDEVKTLIDARLIISKSQIGKGFRYASMQTIGGFDYSAKLSAIRTLLRKKNPPLLRLELSDSTILVQPIELMKGDGILKVRVLPQGIERSIAVSSIFKATVMRWTLS